VVQNTTEGAKTKISEGGENLQEIDNFDETGGGGGGGLERNYRSRKGATGCSKLRNKEGKIEEGWAQMRLIKSQQ